MNPKDPNDPLWTGGKYTSIDATHFILISKDGCMLFFSQHGHENNFEKNIFLPRGYVSDVVKFDRNSDNMSVWRGINHIHDWIYNCLGKDIPE